MMNQTASQSLLQADALTGKVIGEAMHVHRVLGPGFVESIYQNAMLLRLEKIGLTVEERKTLPVLFEGEVMGEFSVDIMVSHCLVLELHAVPALTSDHEVQMVNYLTATKLDVGLLLNFGAPGLEIKRKSRMQDFAFPKLPDMTRTPSGRLR